MQAVAGMRLAFLDLDRNLTPETQLPRVSTCDAQPRVPLVARDNVDSLMQTRLACVPCASSSCPNRPRVRDRRESWIEDRINGRCPGQYGQSVRLSTAHRPSDYYGVLSTYIVQYCNPNFHCRKQYQQRLGRMC
jgi:hypothetical protein